MRTDGRGAQEERILVLAPTGRDALLTRDVLANAGLAAEVCGDMPELAGKLEQGAGALLVAEESLTPIALATLSRALGAQPPWSEIPVLITTGKGETTDARVRAIAVLQAGANVTLLERPIRLLTLKTTLQAALQSRRRQYQMRDLHLQLQRQMESLKVERELRARFISLLAHDLRGPVSAGMMAADLLIRRPERLDERRELGIRIKRNLDRIELMVRDLLDASRVQAGQPLPLRLDEADLATVAADVVEELNHVHGDRLVLHAEEVRGVWSAEELRRAIWNLASNAIKYGEPKSQVTLAVSQVGPRARVSVHNYGRPLSLDDQQRIFEPFGRARSAENSSELGWGLGLTLVRGCVEAHGGLIELESSAEAGTTFTLDIPLDARPFQTRGDASVAAPVSPPTAAPRSTG